jgi:hypothetical protein
MSGNTTPDRGLVHDPREGRRQNIGFVTGFVGWYLSNGLVWLLIGRNDNGQACFLFPLNVIVLIAFLVKRRAIGLGILSALALNLLISLAMSTLFNGACAVPFWV